MTAELEGVGTTPMTRIQRLTIVATGLGMFMVFLDALIVNVALPDIQTKFDVGESGAQAVVTAYSVGMAVTIMWSATLADLHGRRRVYVGSVIVFIAASVLCGVATNFSVLVIGRAIQGLAAGPITVTSLALLSSAFTDTKARTRAIGFWSGVASIGTALGPSIGGILVDGIGWRSIFLVNVPVGVVLVALTLSSVAESRDPSDRNFDHVGQITFGVAIAAFATALITAPVHGWLSVEVLVLFAVAIVSFVAFVRRELRADDPMMDLRLFDNGVYRLALISLFVVFFVAYGVLLIVSQYFQNVRDYSAIAAGFLILPLALGIVIFAPMAGHIEERIGRRRAVLIALSLVALGVAAVLIGLTVTTAVVALGMCSIGVGLALTLVPLTSVSMSVVPPEKAGMASGIMSTQRAIGSTAGYALLGSILALWVDAEIDDSLRDVVTDASERDQIEGFIIDQANPSAFVAEIGPRQPLNVKDLVDRSEIIDAADDVFITGMQISLAVALGLTGVTLVAVALKFPRSAAGAD